MSGFIKDGSYYRDEFHYWYMTGFSAVNIPCNGRAIDIEGGDGVGKGTQVELMKKHLIDRGFEVAVYDFPQYHLTFFGDKVARFLRGEYGSLNEVHPFLASVLYADDRAEVGYKIRGDILDGKVVLFNRYVPSNLAHGGAKFTNMGEAINFISVVEQMEYQVHELPRPDLTLFLDVPAERARKMIATKGEREYVGGGNMDIAEADLTHQEKARIMYTWLCENRTGYKRIECLESGTLMSPEAIHNKLWAEVERVLD